MNYISKKYALNLADEGMAGIPEYVLIISNVNIFCQDCPRIQAKLRTMHANPLTIARGLYFIHYYISRLKLQRSHPCHSEY
jgi:hypothetical protein